jgi:hypothetical protein
MDKIGGLDARRHEKSAYTFTAYGRYLDFPIGCASAIDCGLLNKVLNKVLMHFRSAS